MKKIEIGNNAEIIDIDHSHFGQFGTITNIIENRYVLEIPYVLEENFITHVTEEQIKLI